MKNTKTYLAALVSMTFLAPSTWAMLGESATPNKESMITIEADKIEDFFEAVEIGDTDAIKDFLDSGVDIKSVDAFRNTGLHIASRNQDLPTVKLLIEHGAEVNARNETGHTPLSLAYGHHKPSNLITTIPSEVSRFLVASGGYFYDRKLKLGYLPLIRR